MWVTDYSVPVCILHIALTNLGIEEHVEHVVRVTLCSRLQRL